VRHDSSYIWKGRTAAKELTADLRNVMVPNTGNVYAPQKSMSPDSTSAKCILVTGSLQECVRGSGV